MNREGGRINWGRFLIAELGVAMMIAAMLAFEVQQFGGKARIFEKQGLIFVVVSGISLLWSIKAGPSGGSKALGGTLAEHWASIVMILLMALGSAIFTLFVLLKCRVFEINLLAWPLVVVIQLPWLFALSGRHTLEIRIRRSDLSLEDQQDILTMATKSLIISLAAAYFTISAMTLCLVLFQR